MTAGGRSTSFRRRIVSCAVVAEVLERLGASRDEMSVLDLGLHVESGELRESLQAEISSAGGDVILGYGLCSNAAIGLVNPSGRLAVPRVDDCISLFLGSQAERLRRLRSEPGTYFLTKGWIEASGQPFGQREELVEKYGEKRAERIIKAALKNYTTLAFIDTGEHRIEEYRRLAEEVASALDLRYEELHGSSRLLEKLLAGVWDEEFVVVEPGETIEQNRFW
ncbi:MAG: hypothetical protein CVT63_03680 [Candidatus Anoxymicrobium japonicum]|uniref:DUF1638 domain-containing protein n=1 Tax=Candidatus Anoxymicrobium japonicum TaxID=2013648 RepID=A0A2N3G6M5_9ACTN|nr:MAG: hypothetical protein CVT63_03680 [Candidatus Anoxymicrobium japonicum]